jgi:hypothetical protein
MPAHHAITIRFIRVQANGFADGYPSSDDVLNVTKLGENSVRLVYTENSSDGKVIDVMQFTYQQFIAYLYRAFWLLGLDDDPFKSVQFFIPGYPTVLIDVKSLQQHVNVLLELVMSTCFAWPAIGRASLPAVRNPEQPANGSPDS